MLKPLSDKVILVFEKEEEKKVGSLLLPGSAKTSENIAKVVAVANDVKDVTVGNIVVFEQFAGVNVEHEGQEYIIVKVENIIAVVE